MEKGYIVRSNEGVRKLGVRIGVGWEMAVEWNISVRGRGRMRASH